MKYIKEYLAEELNIQPIGDITLKEDVSETMDEYGLSGYFIIIGGKFTGLFVAHVDYYKWIERKYEALLNK